MERKRKLIVGKIAVVLAVVPILLWAYEYGPNPGYCGVPNENGGATCANSGCHTGTANNPANKGSVTVTFPNGNAYVPGVKQHITVTIADPAPSQVAWGFQLTARLANNTATMAGSFTPTDVNTLLMCSRHQSAAQPSSCLSGAGKGCGFPSSAPACPSNDPLQYIEHSYTGFIQTMGAGSGTYQFDWTPPASDVGNITIYLAGNAGVGGQPTANDDHIYSTTYTLTSPSGGGGPTITGISNAAGGQTGVFPNSYVSIYGTNFEPAGFTDDWSSSIVNGNLPATLDGVKVTIGGQAAYVSYVSATQINVLVPNVGLGSMQATVTTSAEPALPSPSIPSRTARPSSTGRTVSRSPPMPTTPGPSRTAPSPALPMCPPSRVRPSSSGAPALDPQNPPRLRSRDPEQSDQSDLLRGHSRYRHHRGNASFGLCDGAGAGLRRRIPGHCDRAGIHGQRRLPAGGDHQRSPVAHRDPDRSQLIAAAGSPRLP